VEMMTARLFTGSILGNPRRVVVLSAATVVTGGHRASAKCDPVGFPCAIGYRQTQFGYSRPVGRGSADKGRA